MRLSVEHGSNTTDPKERHLKKEDSAIVAVSLGTQKENNPDRAKHRLESTFRAELGSTATNNKPAHSSHNEAPKISICDGMNNEINEDLKNAREPIEVTR
jgi:hypothetical protein